MTGSTLEVSEGQTFVPTLNFRWFSRTIREPGQFTRDERVLQQCWTSTTTEDVDWRDIPEVKEDQERW